MMRSELIEDLVSECRIGDQCEAIGHSLEVTIEIFLGSVSSGHRHGRTAQEEKSDKDKSSHTCSQE